MSHQIDDSSPLMKDGNGSIEMQTSGVVGTSALSSSSSTTAASATIANYDGKSSSDTPSSLLKQISSQADVTQEFLDSINVPQGRNENKQKFVEFGGIHKFTSVLGIDVSRGLRKDQVELHRQIYGTNVFPETKLESYWKLLLEALSDPTLIVLLIAATISLFLGLFVGTKEERSHGWIEGAAIYFAIILVSNIAAGNDYTKQKQFLALEKTSAKDERVSVLRDGTMEIINPLDITVGDIIVMQAGDLVPADAIVVTENVQVMANESSLTGEPDDVKKSVVGDCFLLSSSLITAGESVHVMAIGIGTHSQWGKIKEKLVADSSNTPLQDKLEDLTNLVGYIGMGASFATFAALVISIWARRDKNQGDPSNNEIVRGIIKAAILAITIIVVAIPEGLPLAVTISLAYSTKKMYEDQCFIRVLQACETMGNATNICSDKTGTLTENRMTVVEAWFGDTILKEESFRPESLNEKVKTLIIEQSCINRNAYLIFKSAEGVVLDRPIIIGNKTEGALIMMCKNMGVNYEEVYERTFHAGAGDKTFSFNSGKKRSTCVLHRPDGSVRLYCKGASEWVLKDCSMYTTADGSPRPLTAEKRTSLDLLMTEYARGALRTLVLAHRDFSSASLLPADWEENLPDNSELVCDGIIGIIDPLRDDVKQAVKDAQKAGIFVRMVTGDNITTACAIAKQCGILTENGIAIEGPTFRDMTPAQVDKILPSLQVMARSSPEDKYLLVTRLNGAQLPRDQAEWEKKYEGRGTWENDRDKLMPGYQEEWEISRPDGGQVVGVTGDGTNDAPALKAADVGLAMGITGTKVAQGASDIVILDDKFSSIVRAIMWGRSVYDNVRKFLQFQLTVNITALTIVFIGAVTGQDEPLNAVQMLWVNLVMDTMGAFALGTEPPKLELMHRKPYKRSATLLSRPMLRFMFSQSIFQLMILFILMFESPNIFKVDGEPILEGIRCMTYDLGPGKSRQNGYISGLSIPLQSCTLFEEKCDGVYDDYCLNREHTTKIGSVYEPFYFGDDFVSDCLICAEKDYSHSTCIFNTFIFCQLFNEFNARYLFDELNMFAGLSTNYAFAGVIVVTILFQIFLVYVGGDFVGTSGISADNFLICIALGSLSVVVGFFSRFIPVKEDPNTFFDVDMNYTSSSSKSHKIATSASASAFSASADSGNTSKKDPEYSPVGLE